VQDGLCALTSGQPSQAGYWRLKTVRKTGWSEPQRLHATEARKLWRDLQERHPETYHFYKKGEPQPVRKDRDARLGIWGPQRLYRIDFLRENSDFLRELDSEWWKRAMRLYPIAKMAA
jgi:hypothetical protein